MNAQTAQIEIECPNCGNRMVVPSPGYHNCPVCEQVVDVVRPYSPPQPISKTKRPLLKILASSIGIIAVLFVGLVLLSAVINYRGSDSNLGHRRAHITGRAWTTSETLKIKNEDYAAWHNVVITLDPDKGAFQKTVGYMGTGESKELRLQDFVDREGLRFPASSRAPMTVLVETDAGEASYVFHP